jgi:beta-lactamase regulating signal transducer with metallopeptidase domain
MPWLSLILSNVILTSLIALAAWFVQQRLARPALARVLWILALVKLVTPPLASFPLVELPRSMACALGACGCERHAGATDFIRSTLPAGLLTVWVLGAAITLMAAGRRWIQFRRLLTHARPAPRGWQSLSDRMCSDLSIRRRPAVRVMPGRLPPLVVPGWRRPLLLIPQDLMRQLNRPQRQALVLHELVHIKRRDHLVRLLESAVHVAFWWLPMIGPIGRRLRVCEEACCDAAVSARLPRARHDYARLLLDVVDFANPLPRQAIPHATAMSVAEGLEQRLRSILHPRRAARRGWASSALVLGAAVAILPFGLHYNFAAPPQVRSLSDVGAPPSDKALDAYGCPTFVKMSPLCCPKR